MSKRPGLRLHREIVRELTSTGMGEVVAGTVTPIPTIIGFLGCGNGTVSIAVTVCLHACMVTGGETVCQPTLGLPVCV